MPIDSTARSSSRSSTARANAEEASLALLLMKMRTVGAWVAEATCTWLPSTSTMLIWTGAAEARAAVPARSAPPSASETARRFPNEMKIFTMERISTRIWRRHVWRSEFEQVLRAGAVLILFKPRRAAGLVFTGGASVAAVDPRRARGVGVLVAIGADAPAGGGGLERRGGAGRTRARSRPGLAAHHQRSRRLARDGVSAAGRPLGRHRAARAAGGDGRGAGRTAALRGVRRARARRRRQAEAHRYPRRRHRRACALGGRAAAERRCRRRGTPRSAGGRRHHRA